MLEESTKNDIENMRQTGPLREPHLQKIQRQTVTNESIVPLMGGAARSGKFKPSKGRFHLPWLPRL